MIRVLLVEDHASFRQPLAYLLRREPEVAMVLEAGTVTEARRVLATVDIAVIDLDLPDGSGETLVRELHAANPLAKMLVLTASLNRQALARAIEAGAAGTLHKSATVREVMAAVRRLAAGEALISPLETIELLRLASREREEQREIQAVLARLTPRERDVLRALADGMNDKEIAKRLLISTETVRTHMVNLLGKLGVESRLQALVFAIRHGAVTID